MRPFLSTAIALTLAFCVATAEAGPITGGMSISGDFKPVNGVTGALTTLAAASGLDFVALIGGGNRRSVPGELDQRRLRFRVRDDRVDSRFFLQGPRKHEFPDCSVAVVPDRRGSDVRLDVDYVGSSTGQHELARHQRHRPPVNGWFH